MGADAIGVQIPKVHRGSAKVNKIQILAKHLYGLYSDLGKDVGQDLMDLM